MKKFLAVLLVGIPLLLAGGCSSVQESNNMQSGNETNEQVNTEIEGEKEGAEDEVILTSQEKIYRYLQTESEDALSAYYELLEFKISNYEETIAGDTQEAIFNYTIVFKNFDKDPDTVEYIKEAKEKGDPYYQTYYDEYLQPKEMNLELKAVINEKDEISLYTDVDPHNGREWVETKMADIILSDN